MAFILQLLFVACLCGLVWFVLSQFPSIPEPIRRVVMVVMVVAFCLWALLGLAGLFGVNPFPGFRYR